MSGVVVKTTCARCGHETTVNPGILLLVERDRGSFYSWKCSACELISVKPASADVTALLLTAEVTTIQGPLEADEVTTGAPITWDEVLDFHVVSHDDLFWFLFDLETTGTAKSGGES